MRTMKWLGSCVSAILVWMAVPASAQDEGPPTYYNLSDDPQSLQLIDLESIAGSGSNASVNVIDLFRGKQKFGLVSTWHVDCTHSRMSIAKAMQFAPGWHGTAKAVKTELVNPRSTPRAGTLFGLTCSGNGNLVERRVYRGALESIVNGFWSQ